MAQNRSDEVLLAACREGDQTAWEELIARYQRLIYSLPLQFGLSSDEASDIFQLTCVRLYERLDTVREPAKIGAWLASTTRRLCLDHLAAKRLVVEDGDAALAILSAQEAPLEDDLLLIEAQQHIRNAVDSLPERCHAMLIMLFYDEQRLSYADVARKLGMPIGSIGPIRQRCFEKLRSVLVGMGW